MIPFTCACGKRLQAEEEDIGNTVRCPDCGRESVVPSLTRAPERGAGGRASPRPKLGPRHDEDDDDDRPVPRNVGTSGKAVASLILGIASFLCSILTGIPAIILGIMALREVNRGRGRVTGRGLAITGISLGSLTAICFLPGLLLGLLLPAVQKVRDAANRLSAQNNLKQLALAMHNYEDSFGFLPPAVVYSKNGKPLYSWRVLVLPYLEEAALYNQFHLDEPWDSPHNLPLAQRMPAVFASPGEAGKGLTETHYQVFVGGGAIFDAAESRKPGDAEFRPPRPASLRDIPDGTNKTILIVEAADPVPWTKPDDLPYAPDRPLPRLGYVSPMGFCMVLADGSGRFVSHKVDERLLRAAITRNGHEALDINQLDAGP